MGQREKGREQRHGEHVGERMPFRAVDARIGERGQLRQERDRRDG